MVTLEQLINKQNEMSDIQVIKSFFEMNDMEEEGIDLIHELTESKIKKMKRKQRIVKEWTTHLQAKYLYENYTLDIADRLHNLELDFLSNGGELSEIWFEWAKENIPNIVKPQMYFQPLIEWLDDKSIMFKDTETIEKKIFLPYI